MGHNETHALQQAAFYLITLSARAITRLMHRSKVETLCGRSTRISNSLRARSE